MTSIKKETVIEENDTKKSIELDQFVMPATERGQNADEYIRKLRLEENKNNGRISKYGK